MAGGSPPRPRGMRRIASSKGRPANPRSDMEQTLVILGAGWLVLAVVMGVLWWVQGRRGDAGVVDVAWAAGLGFLGVLCALTGQGDPGRRWILGLVAGLWGLRLSYYLLRDRVLRGGEDGRYRTLRESWGRSASGKFFVFFQAQAALDVVLAVPFAVVSNHADPLGIGDALAVALALVAIGGESIADRQLAAFRADPQNRGQVCREGLWRFSRHPNYFFEWLHWWVYVVLAVGSPLVWLTLLSPALLWFLITRVTGIPPTEAQALASRGAAYREYQRTTSAFFPWFPKVQTS